MIDEISLALLSKSYEVKFESTKSFVYLQQKIILHKTSYFFRGALKQY